MSTLADAAISSNGTHALDYESGPEHVLNLSQTFICTRIPSNPQMTFKACEARRRQSGEKDRAGICNSLTECRNCGGHLDLYQKQRMERRAKAKGLRHPSEVLPEQPDGYHFGENTTHDKFPCLCCGAKVWITGGYCTSCRGQFVYAEQQGLSRKEAIPILRRYFENGGVRPRRGGKANNAKGLIDWKGEKESMGGKKGTCGCCGRPDMTLPQKVNGLYVCGTCLVESQHGYSFDAIRDILIARRILEKVGNKVENSDLVTKQISLPKEAPTAQPEHTESTTTNIHQKLPKKRQFPVLVLTVTEREDRILRWIDEVGKKNRRERKEQVWAILEDLMERDAMKAVKQNA